jgi:hypothetical protein
MEWTKKNAIPLASEYGPQKLDSPRFVYEADLCERALATIRMGKMHGQVPRGT